MTEGTIEPGLIEPDPGLIRPDPGLLFAVEAFDSSFIWFAYSSLIKNSTLLTRLPIVSSDWAAAINSRPMMDDVDDDYVVLVMMVMMMIMKKFWWWRRWW